MKKILLIMFVLLISCSPKESNKTSDNLVSSSDSVLVNSVNNIKVCDTVQRVSDSITQEKVGKVITKIKYLNNTVEKLKIEKLQLSRELKVSKQNVRIDTVFIETRKSFWGKEKRTIKTKSEVQSTETIDSTSTKQTLDSIN
jgi:hypothetical protein